LVRSTSRQAVDGGSAETLDLAALDVAARTTAACVAHSIQCDRLSASAVVDRVLSPAH
jgi:predicted HAD superfamily Cof-like phosphohydrolase